MEKRWKGLPVTVSMCWSEYAANVFRFCVSRAFGCMNTKMFTDVINQLITNVKICFHYFFRVLLFTAVLSKFAGLSENIQNEVIPSSEC